MNKNCNPQILLIEQDTYLEQNLLPVFQNRKYCVQKAATSSEALQKCSNNDYDLILISEDAFSNLMEFVKDLKSVSRAKFMIFTSRLEINSALEFIGDKAIQIYEGKPINSDKISKIVNQIMKKGSSTGQKELKIKRLDGLLEAARQINHLILKEKNIKGMMRKASEILLKTKNYSGCSIFLITGNGLENVAISGDCLIGTEKCESFKDQTQLPGFFQEVVAKRTMKIHIKAEMCDCNSEQKSSLNLAIVPMQTNQKVTGFLNICYEPNKSIDDKERHLFQEVADDLAFAREKIQTEDSLKESERLYRLLAENANDFILLHDLEGYILFFNQAGIQLTGFSEEEIYNMRVQDLIAPEYLNSLKIRKNQRIKGNHSNRRYEIEFINKYDERIPVEVVSTPFEMDDNIQGILVIGHDITEHKKNQKHLQFVHNIYRDTIENAKGIPYRLNYGDQKYQFIGAGVKEVFGIEPSEMNFTNMKKMVKGALVVDQQAPDDYKKYGKMFRNGQVDNYNVELKILTPDGIQKWVSDRSVPIKNESGDVIGSMGIMEDITERKELEEQLLQSQKLESIGNLAAGVAHDFNNMLAVIKGRTQMALLGNRDDVEIEKDLKEVLDASERAADLTKQMLLFSRKKSMEFKPINLNTVISELLKMLKRLIGEDISVITDFDPDIWTIKADKVNMNQVIMNMAVNARDAMPEGGNLIIKTKNISIDRKAAHEKKGLKPGEYVQLQIEDTGSGMRPDIVDKIFDPFFTTKGRAKGTGMGLAVAYGIIKKHNGFVYVDSEVGRGSCFEIYLPAIKTRSTRSRKRKPRVDFDEFKGQGESILVVEDEPTVRKTFRHFLSFGSYQVDTAKNSQQALELFKKNQVKYDLVISDIILPDMNGIDLVEKIRNIKPVRILLVSGYPENESNLERITTEHLPFIQKPFDLKDLLAKVKKIL
ncbi:MAG TPA: PAS domain S-box protein, partial [bacterium]|nr:PAS domain S-box protein [bacterium]